MTPNTNHVIQPVTEVMRQKPSNAAPMMGMILGQWFTVFFLQIGMDGHWQSAIRRTEIFTTYSMA
jgi:hypothetical protein